MALSAVVAQTETEEIEDALAELSQVTGGDWLVAGIIFVAAGLIAFGLRLGVVRSLTPRAGPLVAKLVARLIVTLVIAIGVVYALNRIDVSIGPLLGLLGLLGLAIALSLQEVLGNFISGVMLSLNRPFKIGDEISTGGYDGRVQDVSLRSVTLRTFDGVRVFVPNSTVWSEAIVNYTTLGARRTDLTVGVGYDSDLEETRLILLESLSDVEGVRDAPAPEAYVHEFGGSSINFAVRFWHDPRIAEEWRVRDELARLIKSRLDERGIEIPFPQMVVHISDRSSSDRSDRPLGNNRGWSS